MHLRLRALRPGMTGTSAQRPARIVPPSAPRTAPGSRAMPGTADSDTLTSTFSEIATVISELTGAPLHRPDPCRARELVQGRRVLITGAGGSIGSELAAQLGALDTASLVLVDHSESALHDLELRLYGRALMTSATTVLADVRDREGIEAVFTRHRPDIVLHTAALKHVPLLQRYPREAWRTNVHGTANVLRAANRCGTARVVNISTDKAACAASVLGRSKQIGEALTAHYGTRTALTAVSVRFGNVLGSRGSVLHTFVRQARAGGPLTITDPEATRYLMTIPQACALVLDAAASDGSGRTLVLDMGAPVRILDIAEVLLDHLGVDCPIIYTGLRPGEKQHEQLCSPAEDAAGERHGRFLDLPVRPFDPDLLPGPDTWDDTARALLVPEEDLPATASADDIQEALR